MFQIDPMSRQAVYEQLIEQMERFILSGILKSGDQIPSVRSLSVDLSVNPNTIQKAYSQMDAKGMIYSSRNHSRTTNRNYQTCFFKYARTKQQLTLQQ